MTKQCQIKSIGFKGQGMTPCDAYTKWLESHNVAELDMYDFNNISLFDET